MKEYQSGANENQSVKEVYYQPQGNESLEAILQNHSSNGKADVVARKGIFGNAYPGNGATDLYVQTIEDAALSKRIVRAKIIHVDKGYGVTAGSETSILQREFYPNNATYGEPQFITLAIDESLS